MIITKKKDNVWWSRNCVAPQKAFNPGKRDNDHTPKATRKTKAGLFHAVHFIFRAIQMTYVLYTQDTSVTYHYEPVLSMATGYCCIPDTAVARSHENNK
jgi:hypothetical protein